MTLHNNKIKSLSSFLRRADFGRGAVILDLDGTAVLEQDGKVFVSGSVGSGIKEMVRLGRPVVLNTLRFPLSVIRTVAQEWLELSNEKIPAICLNGSIFGFIEKQGMDEIVFDEVGAFPIEEEQIRTIVRNLGEFLENLVHDMVLFFYPRDWRRGEIIWVPEESKIGPLMEKYQSASQVIACSERDLERTIIEAEACMMFLLINEPKDKLMAYQHKEPSCFFTREGVDKSSGLRSFAENNRLRVSLPDSMGAGNTTMDSFLKDVGLSVVVGPQKLPYGGLRETIMVHDPIELGHLMHALALLHQGLALPREFHENNTRNS